MSHFFFFGVSSESVCPSGHKSMLSLQGSKVPQATLGIQRRWCLVSVGSVWATTCHILITGKLDETGMAITEDPQDHMEDQMRAWISRAVSLSPIPLDEGCVISFCVY